MNKQQWDAMTTDTTPLPIRGECYALAVYARESESRAYKSHSGTDIAEAPKHGIAADMYCLLGEGVNPAIVLEWATEQWLVYAREQRNRVAHAPKIKRGPSAGHSVISHQWVSDDMSWAHHVCTIVAHRRLAQERNLDTCTK